MSVLSLQIQFIWLQLPECTHMLHVHSSINPRTGCFNTMASHTTHLKCKNCTQEQILSDKQWLTKYICLSSSDKEKHFELQNPQMFHVWHYEGWVKF